jgi:hypothetical protein
MQVERMGSLQIIVDCIWWRDSPWMGTALHVKIGLIYAYQWSYQWVYSDIWGETVDLLNNYEDTAENLAIEQDYL